MPRLAVMRKERCNPVGCGDYLCMRLCPINKMGKECIVKGEAGKAQIDEKLCTGCGICPKRCPFEAISIINLPEELTKQPVHQYGINGFHLYNLPIPIFGKVVGIIGKNGIGKSTAMKILAGILKPNLGKIDSEGSFKELIEYYKGTEAQTFFEKLDRGEIKVSYKPQQVDMIPKHVTGTVRELLEKNNEKGELLKVAEILDLNNVLDNDIAQISGGELQRVAIGAAVLKKANLYMFDEPTSFLDVKQRIKISKFIKELVGPETAVIVIEHDLIILDYITDLIQITYGDEGVYGIVSGTKTSRVGINAFLEGYLKEENMRFRDYEIKFEKPVIAKSSHESMIVSWDGVEKQLGRFSLKADLGSIYKNKVTGVLGENGIGKTSFVKILAGVIEKDKGTISQNVSVSYKPQYLDSGKEDLVMIVLKKAIEKYNNDLIHQLRLKNLLTRQINELSGGELQRVAIALALSQEAELFLMDEPSAYLDVEQRIVVSRIIKDMMFKREKSAMVVDHDILFIDYLSDNLIVFDGKPAISGVVKGPFNMEDGMNNFLKDMEITMRRDLHSKRPRVNKPDSQKDQEQKKTNKLYYV